MTSRSSKARFSVRHFFSSAAFSIRSALTGKVNKPKSKYSGLLELDRKIEKFVNFDGGFFIEIGAWDGLKYSNSLYFEKFRHWKGVLIEPAPNEYLKCRENRPNATVVCCACVPLDYPDRYLPMTYCASMTIAHSTESATNLLGNIDSHVDSGKKFLDSNETVYEFGALAKPLSRILDEQNVSQKIDLLILDVEGFELNVLKGIDFARHGPRFICVEVWDRSEIESFLAAKGYKLLSELTCYDDHQDLLFARNSESEQTQK